MSTCRPIHVNVDAPMLVRAVHSVGAHLGAKLGLFHSDERTLTDELCDMLWIWAGAAAQSGSGGRLPIDLTIQKLPPQAESIRGADLEMVLSTPDGIKRALFQAKVLDPSDGRLRHYSARTTRKLQDQLRKAESEVGTELTFLLLYVPWSLLDGSVGSFSTWEQGFAGYTGGGIPSYLGATVVPMQELVSSRGGWRRRPAFRDVGRFGSRLPHLSLTRVLLEMASCRRGQPHLLSEVRGDAGAENTSRLTLRVEMQPARV